MTDQQTNSFGETVVARAGTYYRNTRYLMAAMCVVAGMWFGYDGWKGWPDQNIKFTEANDGLHAAQKSNDTDKIREYSEALKTYKFHEEFQIRLQKQLACGIPPLGLVIIAWTLYRSRGQYKLSGTTLSIPGHPDIQLDDITRIDKQKWDRKGIVHLHYTTSTGQSGIITLDDFIYDRPPTDEIFKRIEQYLLPAAQEPTAA